MACSRSLRQSFIYFCQILLTLSSVHAEISCSLKWEPDGFGNLPGNAVDCGSNDVVARVFHNGEWIPGRMTPSKGLATITLSGTVYEFHTYEVLTNPDNCTVQWIPGYGGIFSENSVQVDELSGIESVYISRSVVAGMTLGGKLVPSAGAVFIAYEGEEVLRREYEVLISIYPKLVVHLEKFKFDRTNMGSGHAEIIGIEELQNRFNADNRYVVNHEKTVEERFVLADNLSWIGISHVSLSFPVWYGSSDVTAEFELDNGSGDELVIVRPKTVSTSREISVKAGSASNSNHMQICSTVTVIEDEPQGIPFTANGVFKADGLRSDQISFLLQELGRLVTKVRKNEVVAELKGTLHGRFPVRVSSYVQAAESPVCVSYDS